VASACTASAPGCANAATQRYRAVRPASGAARIASISVRRFSSSVAPGPANRADRGPGAPPSTSTSIPESSATAGTPTASAAAGHHDVEVDLRARVLLVAEVEQGRVPDDPGRHCGDLFPQRIVRNEPSFAECPHGERECEVARRDRGGAGAAVGLEDVAVDPD